MAHWGAAAPGWEPLLYSIVASPATYCDFCLTRTNVVHMIIRLVGNRRFTLVKTPG